MSTLTDRDLAMLAFERLTWRRQGAKEAAIREQFGMTATGYYQRLNALIWSREALEHDPVLVKRLRRLAAPRLTG